jgi:glycosyltransferase involved in cell wall biosynthesis
MSIVSKYIKENDLDRRVIKIGFVDEDDLPKIYNLADLLLFPSLYEGFGLPILEAQACGCPVLTSNVTSCPEVAGDGAHIVDPYSVDEIRDGILKIIKDNNYKEQLIKKGFENIKRFSWEKSARKILELID